MTDAELLLLYAEVCECRCGYCLALQRELYDIYVEVVEKKGRKAPLLEAALPVMRALYIATAKVTP